MRRYTNLIVLAAFISLIGGASPIPGLGSGGVSVAQAQIDDGSGQRETLSGVLNVLRGDPRPGLGDEEHKTEYLLVDDRGQATELSLDEEKIKPLGGPLTLDRKRVKVKGTKEVKAQGTREAKAERAREAGNRLRVEALGLEQTEDATTAAASAPQPAVTGPQPTVTLLCRFEDSVGTTPHEKPWFERLMGGSEPGLDHYWQETSYANINLAGSKVMGWYNLPRPRSVYFPNGSLDWYKVANDCTAKADPEVNFPSYLNINLMFNQELDGYAWGGSQTLALDGKTQTYGMTWMPPWGYENQAVMEHEMGHSYGLPHSSGPYKKTYDSSWDPMSSTWGSSYCSPGHAEYGCVGAGTISFHKSQLGWIPSGSKYTATADPDQRISIDRLGTPASSASNYLMAQIPIEGSTTQFYTVESRRFVGYDGKLPAEAVVIHKVDTTLQDRNAQVIDFDGDGDPNDAGARWLPGETFTDVVNGISVRVNGATSSGYDITINPAPPDVTNVTPDNAATDVALDTNVTALFSKKMDPSTLVTGQDTLATGEIVPTSSTVKLYERVRKKIRQRGKKRWVWRWVPVSAAVKYDSEAKMVTLNPYGNSGTLAPNRSHLVVISTGAKDEAGNALAQDYSWTFSTGVS